MFGDFDFSDLFDGGGPSLNEPDYILAYLVSSLVNMGGAPLGITLMVRGTIITGTLIGEREYLDILSDMLQAQVRDALAERPEDERRMAERAFDLREFTEDFYPEGDEDEDEDEGPTPMDIVHLHLKNPLVISPQPSIGFSSGPLPVMRIRLINIDGWMLGTSIPDDMDDFLSPNGSPNGDIKH